MVLNPYPFSPVLASQNAPENRLPCRCNKKLGLGIS